MATTAETQYFYLVRHAEKSAQSEDPPLSACGEAQAKALATLLSQVSISQLYHSNYQRTRQTASALEQTGRSLQSYDPRDLAALVSKLQQEQGSVLVAGHSNTTPQLATLLSGLPVPAMTEQDYGWIYQLARSGPKAQSRWSFQLLKLPQPAECQNKGGS